MMPVVIYINTYVYIDIDMYMFTAYIDRNWITIYFH